MKIAFIGSKEMATLFKMAGVSYAGLGENVEKEFDEIVKSYDVVVIEGKYAEKVKNKILYFRLLHDKPIIVEIPGKEKVEREDTIRKIIARAVGVDIGD